MAAGPRTDATAVAAYENADRSFGRLPDVRGACRPAPPWHVLTCFSFPPPLLLPSLSSFQIFSVLKFRAHYRLAGQADNVLLRRPITVADPLPPGWEVRMQPGGAPFFLEHTARRTTFADPRPSQQYLGVRIVSGRNMRKKEGSKHDDPRVLLRVRSSDERPTNPLALSKPVRHATFCHTAVKKGELSPTFDESFYFKVRASDALDLYVYDWQRTSRDDLMGFASFTVASIASATDTLSDDSSQVTIWRVVVPMGVEPPAGGGAIDLRHSPSGELTVEFCLVGTRVRDAASERQRARRELDRLRLTCRKCNVRFADAVNSPCGHAMMCWECTEACREDAGLLCPACREPSTTTRIIVDHTCCVCFGTFRSNDVTCTGDCGHLLCVPCAVRVVRDALGNAERFPLQCPCIEQSGEQCEEVVLGPMLRTLRIASMVSLEPGQELTAEEIDRFEMFTNMTAVPASERLYCPEANCGGLIVTTLDCADESHAADLITCPYCQSQYCFGCRLDHRPYTCTQYAAIQRENQDLSVALLAATSKPCPGCHAPVVHSRGHRCHHVRTLTACACTAALLLTNKQTNRPLLVLVCISSCCQNHAWFAQVTCVCSRVFCFACLGPWPCVNTCPMYCSPACNCPPCLECAPGLPCRLCSNDERCLVCNPP